MSRKVPRWTAVVPFVACAVLAAAAAIAAGHELGWVAISCVFATLITSVIVAVHHAEVVAHRLGEPFGALVLALAVTVIELALVLSMMLAGGPGAGTLARDTVFAAVMIVCNGVVGLCLVVGGLRHHVLSYQLEGAGHLLAVLAPLTTLVLIVPSFTTTTPGPVYSQSQLLFAGGASLLLWGLFAFTQNVRHRDYFLPVGESAEDRAERPSGGAAAASLGLLIVSLVAVVGLAKTLAPSIEAAVRAADAPQAVVGIAIALLVLLPETAAAVRAAAHNNMQTSLNLALGSVLATIGLTIPAVAGLSIYLGRPLTLGLPPLETSLLALTLLVSTITLASGRSTILHGAVHLVIFGAFLLFSIVR